MIVRNDAGARLDHAVVFAVGFDFPEAFLAPGNQYEIASFAGQRISRGTSDAGTRAGNLSAAFHRLLVKMQEFYAFSRIIDLFYCRLFPYRLK